MLLPDFNFQVSPSERQYFRWYYLFMWVIVLVKAVFVFSEAVEVARRPQVDSGTLLNYLLLLLVSLSWALYGYFWRDPLKMAAGALPALGAIVILVLLMTANVNEVSEDRT